MGTDHSKTLCFLRLASFEELERPLGRNLGQAFFALSFSPWQRTGTVNLAVKSPGGQKRYIKKRPAKIAAKHSFRLPGKGYLQTFQGTIAVRPRFPMY